jgi:hypothetical protein
MSTNATGSGGITSSASAISTPDITHAILDGRQPPDLPQQAAGALTQLVPSFAARRLQAPRVWVFVTEIPNSIVLPVNQLLARMRRGEAAPDPTTKKCPECLSDVPIAARRCAFCTSPIAEPT